MNKEKIKKMFTDTFVAVETFKQNRIRMTMTELKKHLEMDEAIEALTELYKALKQSEHMERVLKEGLPKIEKDENNGD